MATHAVVKKLQLEYRKVLYVWNSYIYHFMKIKHWDTTQCTYVMATKPQEDTFYIFVC